MDKAVANYVVDIFLCISFLLVAITGIIKIKAVMDYLGLAWNTAPVPTLSFIHDWSGVVMVILVVVHIALNWKWLVCMTKAIFGKGSTKTCKAL